MRVEFIILFSGLLDCVIPETSVHTYQIIRRYISVRRRLHDHNFLRNRQEAI